MKRSAVYSLICGVSACVFLFSSIMTCASWRVQDDTVNKITMGSVHGKIVEEFAQNTEVYPDADVTKIVQVKNTGTIDAIPRVKIEKVWGDSRDENGNVIVNTDLSTDNIEIDFNTDDWYYNPKDGYYYYKDVLSPDEITKPLFKSFCIKENESIDDYRNKFADIIVTMEIIQAGGDSLSYWGMSYEDLEITYKQSEREDLVTSVAFHDPEEGFTFDVNNGDLFANFKDLVPGESRSQTIEITNKWGNGVYIYLWADFIEQEDSDETTKELVNQLLHEYANIIITDENGGIIYDGPIWGNPDVSSYDTNSMKYPYCLGHFDKNQTKKVNVDLYLSQQMDNKYLDLLGLIKWVFSAQGDSIPDITTSEPEQTSPPTDTSKPEQTTPPIDTNTSEPEQTTPPTTVSKPEQTTPPAATSEPEQTDPSITTSETVQTVPTTTTSEPVMTKQTTSDSSTGTITSTEYGSPNTGGGLKARSYMTLAICSLIMMTVTFIKSKQK